MKLAQIIFPVILLATFLLVRNYDKLISKILTRVFFATFVLVFLVFIIFPNLTFGIANFIGIGRGSDLVFYLTTIALFALGGIMILKDQFQNQRFSNLVRAWAVRDFMSRKNAENRS